MKTAPGRTVTVSITAATVFGTQAHPATKSDFTAGSKVLMVVTATRGAGGSHLVARRITAPIAGTRTQPSATPAPSV
ncbi:MAG: hypothetical protein ABIY38_09580 [Rhodococcus sp. (in: high G+C Gram-positive bacteria)]